MELYYVLSGVVGIGVLSIFASLIYYDLRYQRLPNILIIALTILSLFFTALTEIVIEQKSCSIVIINHLLALIPVSGLYLIIYIVSKGKLVGLGDVKLGIPIAILLPWQGVLAVLVVSNVLALLTILPRLVTKKIKPNTKIAFGPFLIISTLVVFLIMKFFVDFF